jgi:hypothetical protein
VQEVEYVKAEDKLTRLADCLQKTSPPVLVFAEKTRDVDMVHEYLLTRGINAVAIHGAAPPAFSPPQVGRTEGEGEETAHRNSHGTLRLRNACVPCVGPLQTHNTFWLIERTVTTLLLLNVP